MLHGGDIFRNQGIALDYSVNTSPLGMPGIVREAILCHLDDCERYPDPLCGELRAALSRAEGVPPEHICCGNGAADLIFRLCLALRPRDTLIAVPAFSEYGRAALLAGSRVRHHVLREEDDFALTETFLDSITVDTDLVVLCNPNNPTGKLVKRPLLEAVLERCRSRKALLMVDECFLPFTEESSLAEFLFSARTGGGPSLAVLKAFTKTYSLAGLRIGYLLCDGPEFAAKISGTGQAWSVSAPAQYAGLAALQIPSWVEDARKIIREERPRLAAELRSLGCRVVESDANFILFRCEKPLFDSLAERGILIRTCGSFQGLGGSWYRIGLKKRGENDLLISALRETARC